MIDLDWIKIDIATTGEGKDTLIPELIDLDISGFEIQDSEPLSDLLSGRLGNWDYIGPELIKPSEDKVIITFYIPKDEEAMETTLTIMALLEKFNKDENMPPYSMELSDICDEDWANNWKEYFKPIEIGEKLLIRPSWEEISGGSDRIVLEIDPATAFGTGQHDSTKLCLMLIEKYVGRGQRIIDLGCGSGILSIASILLGAHDATAVDIDENSTIIALENAMQNGISPEFYETFVGDITYNHYLIDDCLCKVKTDGGYDVVIANIVADVLIEMSGIFGRFLKAKGMLIVSGIIKERKDEVFRILSENDFELCEEISTDDWCAAAFRRKLPWLLTGYKKKQ